MTSRFPFRLAPAVGPFALTLTFTLAGCGCTDALNAGPLEYVESAKLTTDLKDKPELQKEVRQKLATMFGADPQHIKVPTGAGLPGGGYRLANHWEADGKVRPIKIADAAGKATFQEGGYGLYRKHCLHCHGVSGAGDGPTSAFLYPRPRDYRKGIFKFTSTIGGQKPTRDDLRKTIRNGLHGTSMPAFEALMSDSEISQVLDYMIFLTLRGETEEALIIEAASTGELTADATDETTSMVFRNWKNAENEVENPPIPKPESTPESVLRGRDLFLGVNKTGKKVECTGCHDAQGVGDGPSFIRQDVFNAVVFGGTISKRFKLTAGQLDILDVVTELDAKWNAQHESHGTSHGSAETANAVPPSMGNLIAGLKTKLGIAPQDKVESLKSKMGYDDAQSGAARSFEEIVENLVKDLEDKSLVSHSLGLGGWTYQAAIDRKSGDLWNNSLDEWENPLRPNNLNRGVYKGGRRPIDIFWRIAKGINGAKMPAHYPALDAEKIWDLVNFVLALPYEPSLLDGPDVPAPIVPTPASATPAVAQQ